MSDPSLTQTVSANCTVKPSDSKDDVLAVAVSRISSDYHVTKASAVSAGGDVVNVRVTFRTPDHDHAARLAGLTGSALAYRWPTDSVRLNGKPVKGAF